jgi:cytochrome d ubiquinol oxidase subunit I
MDTALSVHRFHFAFTITYHYLFPQLTMGLALLIMILKTAALRTGSGHYNRAARFWAKIFAINFAMDVVTGIPMEFQFGTNWSRFAMAAGGVIGHTLAMEGVFSFFLESSFLGLFLSGEKRLGPRGHWVVGFLLFLGTWLSGFFIVATNAWMQHPVGYRMGPDGRIHLTTFSALFTNPWLPWQYLHTMIGAVLTGSAVMASVGAFYLLTRRHEAYGRTFVSLGVLCGFIAAVLLAFPTGDRQAKLMAEKQPVGFAAMEGVFGTEEGVGLVIMGQPDVERMRLDNPLEVPGVLSFLTHRRWSAEIKGLESFPKEDWPHNIPLLYYAYHIMVGLGTIMIAVLTVAAFLLWKRRLYSAHWMLCTLMLLLPFPYIANTAGWMTAELGRQPWVIYGLMRTSEGYSVNVSAGNALFSLLGFMGVYAVLSVLFLFLVCRKIYQGPESEGA